MQRFLRTVCEKEVVVDLELTGDIETKEQYVEAVNETIIKNLVTLMGLGFTFGEIENMLRTQLDREPITESVKLIEKEVIHGRQDK